jgi:hypothetical protein
MVHTVHTQPWSVYLISILLEVVVVWWSQKSQVPLRRSGLLKQRILGRQLRKNRFDIGHMYRKFDCRDKPFVEK